MPVAEAQRWINKWTERSPKAWSFIERCRMAPQRGQNLVTIFGRKKRHWLVTQENLIGLQNEASNFPHQSIAHDICLLGGAKAEPILRPYGIDPVNEVHDEVMFECPDIPEVISWAKYVIITCLESIAPEWGLTLIPFIAEADVGRRWSIYRNPKEFPYEYIPAGNSEEWWSPNQETQRTLDSYQSHIGRKDPVLLGDQPLMEESELAWNSFGQGLDSDSEEFSRAELELESVWGPFPSSAIDSRDH